MERGERRRRREEEGKRLKKEGNKAFRREDYSRAVACFTEAIAQSPWDITLYTNRALVCVCVCFCVFGILGGGEEGGWNGLCPLSVRATSSVSMQAQARL